MRHLKKGKKFHRKRGQRVAFLKSLINNLILKEKIETTEVRAKQIRPRVEKLITLGKKQNLAAFRMIVRRLGNKKTAQKIYFTLAPRFQNRKGGYLQIIKGSKRKKGDGAKTVIIKFV